MSEQPDVLPDQPTLFDWMEQSPSGPAPAPVVPVNDVDLPALFHELNTTHFAGELPPVPVGWNARLRTTAGRFCSPPPVIQLGLRYHLLFPEDLEDTLKHEMTHLWLFVRRRPHGHTAEFRAKLDAIGASRYARRCAQLERKRHTRRYVYGCPVCGTQYLYKRKIRNYSCGKCSKTFDPAFRLKLVGILEPDDPAPHPRHRSA